jgi:hypothetical protein
VKNKLFDRLFTPVFYLGVLALFVFIGYMVWTHWGDAEEIPAAERWSTQRCENLDEYIGLTYDGCFRLGIADACGDWDTSRETS